MHQPVKVLAPEVQNVRDLGERDVWRGDTVDEVVEVDVIMGNVD